ncbi:MAG: tRNA 4-thiouridine(8) synthase ThiI [Spirochaetes bacterium]|nr:tRNA 4-thiouridine(8) synthase ThiI [Spirochaetota bacterium]
MTTWLLKLGELTLKGKNLKSFESVLKRNLLAMLSSKGLSNVRVTTRNGRFYVYSAGGETENALVENVLCRLFGITGWARTVSCTKNVSDIMAVCVEEAKKLFESGAATYKVEARRADKSFPLDSYQICVSAGGAIAQAVGGLKVNVRNPDCIIYVEVREKVYVYSDAKKGLGGLPVGTAGRGLLLLSGGIDSPVAGFLMAGRGMGIDALHFHSYPYTSLEAKQKALDAAAVLGSYTMGLRLYVVAFTTVQLKIKESAPQSWITVLLRMAMMECAEKLAEKIKSKCLVSGESLSQVASQTIENLTCIQSRVNVPVLRPLIGSDKDSIITTARKIGSYEISIRPHQDCCMLFNPPHPVLHGDAAQAGQLYEALELSPLIDEALASCETVTCGC